MSTKRWAGREVSNRIQQTCRQHFALMEKRIRCRSHRAFATGDLGNGYVRHGIPNTRANLPGDFFERKRSFRPTMKKSPAAIRRHTPGVCVSTLATLHARDFALEIKATLARNAASKSAQASVQGITTGFRWIQDTRCSAAATSSCAHSQKAFHQSKYSWLL